MACSITAVGIADGGWLLEQVSNNSWN